MTTHIFGIRHHGPGSARSLVQALRALQPDCVLIEGPPDADGLLPLLAHPATEPPIALLIYAADNARDAVYYPFAVFSPEYQAIRYGLEAGAIVRFMDLPQTHQLGIQKSKPEQPEVEREPENPRTDPLGFLAQAAGYSDGERWWEQMVEQRRDSVDVFAAILEAMTALREHAPPERDTRELQREAWMRQTIRAAEREGYTRIAVVCGAWHGPALVDRSNDKADAALLKGLAKTKVLATLSPWTYGRLATRSGYGAGIDSPGFYEHVWQFPNDVTQRWVARVARLLREQDLDASAAHVVEAVRLAEALTALRDRPLPGLDELNEAAQAVLCNGSPIPMRLIHDKLIVGECLGSVPPETPMTPLQLDLQREQKRLRLPPEATWRDYDFDLRKPNDLYRSRLLHRLVLLQIPWGALQRTARAKGTFHEHWRVEWQPEFAVTLIEASMWGATVEAAASGFTRDAAARATNLPALTRLVDQALLAELPDAVADLMQRIEEAAALSSDVLHLMEALPPLAQVLRYGNVRRTDAAAVGHVVDGLVTRVCISLPGACGSLDDAAAAVMFDRITETQQALALGRNPEHEQMWYTTLRQIADGAGHGLVAGRCCRLLLDAGAITPNDVAERLSFALSPGATPHEAAAWVEGTLKGSGLLLIHHDIVWQLIDTWLSGLGADQFQHVLPLLRRTFATFTQPERRQMGERAKAERREQPSNNGRENEPALDLARATKALPLITQLLGIENKEQPWLPGATS